MNQKIQRRKLAAEMFDRLHDMITSGELNTVAESDCIGGTAELPGRCVAPGRKCRLLISQHGMLILARVGCDAPSDLVRIAAIQFWCK